MVIDAVAGAPGLTAVATARTQALGLSVHPVIDDMSTPDAAISVAGRVGRLIAVVADHDEDRKKWQTSGLALLAEATAASSQLRTQPVTVVVLPATSTPAAGPVAVVSPADAVSAYELTVGAVIAASMSRPVEHLNGRGTAGSVVYSATSARRALRAAVPEWHERATTRPEHSLRDLSTRPVVVVIAVPPGSVEVGRVAADHPDADIVLIFDDAHAAHGPAIAAQIGSIVEMSLSVDFTPSPSTPTEPRHDEVDMPPAGLTRIRASDVVHARITDSSLELTNRTARPCRLTVALGSSFDDEIRAVFEAVLEPGATRSEPMTHPAVAALTPPTAVRRHWSHGDADVFEGGERRIVRVAVELLDPAHTGPEHANSEHVHSGHTVAARGVVGAPNGLDFAMTARELAALAGGESSSPTVLPEPVPVPTSAAAPTGLWDAFAAAVAVGAGALTVRNH